MRKFNGQINKLTLHPHNILICYTSPVDCEMERTMVLEKIDGLAWNEYLVLYGTHCSCYNFDETMWDGIVYSKKELKKLASENSTDFFWRIVHEHF